MAQRHMDRLTSFDTSFLANEKSNGHMAIGAVLVCEGERAQPGRLRRPHPQPPPPAAAPAPAAALPAAAASARRSGSTTPTSTSTDHVRRVTLPAPGHRGPVPRAGRRAAAPPLDRSKPLWELILVEGFEDDRFAIVYKTHHAMADGISAVDIGMLLFDVEPKREPVARRRSPGRPHEHAVAAGAWSAAPAPASPRTFAPLRPLAAAGARRAGPGPQARRRRRSPASGR